MNFLKNFVILVLYILAFAMFAELCTNILALRFLFPIKNAYSYGYLTRKSFDVVIPLNKYDSRYKAQVMLPVEILKYKLNQKELFPVCDTQNNLCGYKNESGTIQIKQNLKKVYPFENSYAKVAISKNNKIFYGSIDKNGNWVIKPKYSHICTLSRYYTRACIDDNHCGLINIFGDEVTSMSYDLDTLKTHNQNFAQYFCKLHLATSINSNSCF